MRFGKEPKKDFVDAKSKKIKKEIHEKNEPTCHQ
jgi:hypothetical protein